MKKWLFVLNLISLFTLSACWNDNEGDQETAGIEGLENVKRACILYEGNYNGNDSGIDVYAPEGGENGASLFVGDVYMTQNGERLGDVGQDLISYKDHLYASITGSRILVKMTETMQKCGVIEFNDTEGDPRYLAAKDGKIYVSLYGGYVAKIDAETFVKEDMVKVGLNPEGIVECNGKLYVNNSGWGNDKTMSVIDLSTFKVVNTIEVAVNPNEMLTANGKVFVQSYGGVYPNYDYQVQMYDPETGNVTRLASATKVAAYDGMLYIVYSEINWATYSTTNFFSVYDIEKGILTDGPFLKNMPKVLQNTDIYMIEIDPANGDFYVCVSDYVSNGTVYRFNHDGDLIDVFGCTGLNPTKTVFIE